jgi:rhodanese-related sulfurtransferase
MRNDFFLPFQNKSLAPSVMNRKRFYLTLGLFWVYRKGMLKEITVTELKKRLDQQEKLQLVDVREEEEFTICNLGGELIPLGELPRRFSRIATDRPVVMVCHHGLRSAQAIHFLQQRHGYTHLLNLKGGIHAWATTIDPDMPVY